MAWRITAWRAPYRWFASDHRSGVDGLVQLNRWFTAGQLAEVDRALVGAFLADLRAVYRSWRTTDRYTHRPVLLLDDADAPGGEVTGGAQLRFLDVLLDIRNQHHQERGQGDPLVVVATPSTRVVPNVASYPFGREEITRNLVEGLHPTTPGRAPIHRLDLTEGAAAPLGDHGAGHLSDRLAYGHPWARTQIEQAVVELGGDDVDAERALTPAVVTGALKMITRACSSLVTEGLVTRSGVDEQDDAAHQVLEEMLALGGLEPGQAWELRQRLDKLVALRLWGAPGSGAMHPFFRTILLSTLSDRDSESLSGWNEVFRRLAQHHHPEHGDWHTHYELARSGDVVPAAHYLIGALHEPGAGQHWLDKLDRITRAPRQRDHKPDQHYQERRMALLAQLPDDATDQLTLMARLVTALWLGANHLGAADRIEILNAAEALSHLAAPLHDGDLRDTLFKRAAQYRADHGQA